MTFLVVICCDEIYAYSVIAVMGLVENSSVVLVASMLISPLMVCTGQLFCSQKNNFDYYLISHFVHEVDDKPSCCHRSLLVA